MRPGVLILMITLAGCAAQPRGPAPVDWPLRRAELVALDTWRMTGRVAVAVNDEGASASLDWRQAGETSRLALSGPFGTGALQVTLSPQGLSLEDGRGGHAEGEAARAVLAERLGLDVPLAALRYWVMGAPAPDLPFVETLGPDGRPASFEQAGWRVAIAHYAAAAGGLLPARLTAEREGARLKLAVSRWDLPQ